MTTLQTIRPYLPQDRETVLALLLSPAPWNTLGYSRSQWEAYFAPFPEGREGFVIEIDGQVAGLAVLRPRFLFGDYLELFGIAERLRGQGLGSTLLRWVEKRVFQRGHNLFICVSDFNDGGRRFYARHGYTVVGPLSDLLVQGRAELLLRKTFGPAQRSGERTS